MSAAEFERVVVGSLLAAPRVTRLAMEHATPADFADLRLGTIYRGICRMVGEQQPVDPVTVSEHLADWGIVGLGFSDLLRMQHEVDAPTSVGAAARQVRDAALRRGLTVIAQTALRDAGNPECPIGESATAAATALADLEDGGSSRFEARPLGEILTADYSHDWVVPGLLERRERLILTGVEGGGKSTLIRQFALLAAAGVHPLKFTPIDPVRVLVVDAENSEGQWARQTQKLADAAARVGSVDPRETVHVVCTGAFDLLKTDNLLGLHQLVDDHRPDVLVIGPLYKLAPRAMNSDDDAIPLLAALDALRMRGPALLMEAHAGKAETASGSRKMAPRGSAAFLGWPEFGLGLRPVENTPEFELVRWRGEREQREWPRRLFRGGAWPWTPVDRQLRSVA